MTGIGGVDARLRVLVCDGDPSVVGTIAQALGQADFEIVTAYRAEAAVARLVSERADAVIVGAALDVPQTVLIPRLVAHVPVPVLAVCSYRDEAAVVAVLEAGADDVLDRVLRPLEIVARTRAVLRRRSSSPISADDRLPDGLRIDLGRRLATVDGREVDLTPTEFELLSVIAARRGDVVDHRTLLRAAWSGRTDVDPDVLRTHLARLNGKLVARGHPGLRNARGKGYALRIEGGGPA